MASRSRRARARPKASANAADLADALLKRIDERAAPQGAAVAELAKRNEVLEANIVACQAAITELREEAAQLRSRVNAMGKVVLGRVTEEKAVNSARAMMPGVL